MGDRETHLVQNLADTQWRLDRIPNLETGLFALGRMRYADLFQDEADERLRMMLLDAHILMTDAKHFKNLHLHESRLRRQYQQDLKELRDLQKQRQPEEKTTHPKPSRGRQQTNHSQAMNGFEFTNTEKRSQEEEPGTDQPYGNVARIGAGSV